MRLFLQEHVAIQDARVVGSVKDEIQHTDEIDGRERVVLVLLPAPELRVAGPIGGRLLRLGLRLRCRGILLLLDQRDDPLNLLLRHP